VKLRLKQFALLLVALFVALLVAEVALRLLAPLYQANDPAAYVYDEELGYRLRDGYYSLLTTDFQQEIRANRRGYVNYQEDFAAYPKLVFAVGDSYTQGTGLPVDAAYPSQLDLILNVGDKGLYAPRYGVVNLGVGAYGGEQELLLLQRAARDLRPPDVVLYLGCDNDFDDDQLFRSGYRHRHLVEGSPHWGRWARPLQWLTNNLQLVLRAKLALGEMRRGQVLSDKNGAENSSGSGGPSVAERQAQVLEKIAAQAKAYNARLVVSWANQTDSYGWLQQWAAQRQIPFADWRVRVKAAQAATPALPTRNPHSGGHHRVWVNRFIAEEFARHLQP
jgi:lysophospholipase L1-like esterase